MRRILIWKGKNHERKNAFKPRFGARDAPATPPPRTPRLSFGRRCAAGLPEDVDDCPPPCVRARRTSPPPRHAPPRHGGASAPKRASRGRYRPGARPSARPGRPRPERHQQGEMINVAGNTQLSRYTTNDDEVRENVTVIIDSLISARRTRPGGGKRNEEPAHSGPYPDNEPARYVNA